MNMAVTTIHTKAIEYFNRGKLENPRYWSRFKEKPEFKNATVADLGSGFGSLCIDIAKSGAKRVVGYELNPNLVNIANLNLEENYPEFKNIVEFKCCDIRDNLSEQFDYFVSKDAFEHVIDLEPVLGAIKQCLKPGGRLYAGFGPIWNSPRGDHGRVQIPLPWGHIIFSETYLIHRLNHLKDSAGPFIESISHLGLNKLSLHEYQQLFYNSGMSVIAFEVNVSDRPISKLFSILRHIPYMEEYFSHNIYCILEKTQKNVLKNL